MDGFNRSSFSDVESIRKAELTLYMDERKFLPLWMIHLIERTDIKVSYTLYEYQIKVGVSE